MEFSVNFHQFYPMNYFLLVKFSYDEWIKLDRVIERKDSSFQRFTSYKSNKYITTTI